MRKIILSLVALSIAAFVSGCSQTTSCEAKKPAPVVVQPAPAPVVVDAKEASVK